MGRLTVITLGSGNEEWLPDASKKALCKAKRLLLRTEQHPVAAYLRREGIAFESFDSLYEQNEDFDSLNRMAADILLNASEQDGLCYAVSDATNDTVLAHLNSLKNCEITILPGVSHSMRCLSLLKENAGNVYLCAAEDFPDADYLPAQALLLTELHSRECAGNCKLKLCSLAGEEIPIGFITGNAQSGSLKLSYMPLYEMDRQKHYNHLTAVFVPGLSYEQRQRYSLQDYLRVMERLRSPGGCPWDQKQTHESLLPYLLEESQEYIQAVEEEDTDNMLEELGDVLHQVVFHSTIAKQCGEFEFADVSTAICRKMMERHPYVFAGEAMPTAEEAFRLKEERKRKERGQHSIAEAMEGIPKSLSPMLRATKVQKQGELTGEAAADTGQTMEKLCESFQNLKEMKLCTDSSKQAQNCLGDCLFAMVSLCRQTGVDPDIALGLATDRYIQHFSEKQK